MDDDDAAIVKCRRVLNISGPIICECLRSTGTWTWKYWTVSNVCKAKDDDG